MLSLSWIKIFFTVSLEWYRSFMNTSFLTSCGNAEGLKLMLLTLASQEPIHQAEVGGKNNDGEALHRFKRLFITAVAAVSFCSQYFQGRNQELARLLPQFLHEEKQHITSSPDARKHRCLMCALTHSKAHTLSSCFPISPKGVWATHMCLKEERR